MPDNFKEFMNIAGKMVRSDMEYKLTRSDLRVIEYPLLTYLCS